MSDLGATSTSTGTVPTTTQKVAAEVIGTFVLVLIGCGAIVYAREVGAIITVTTVALAFGLAMTAAVHSFGRVSGGHFNPATTLAAVLSGRLAWRELPAYVAAQLAGGLAAAAVLLGLVQGFAGHDGSDGLAQSSFGDQGTGYAAWSAFLLEMLLTAVLVTVVLAVTDARHEHPGSAPVVIGLTLAAAYAVALPATGGSLNPARSVGPGLLAGTDAILQLWLFVLAPLLGAAVAGLAYPMLFGHDREPVPGSGVPRPAPRAREAAVAPTAAAEPAPIIQDGWQWDPVAHQWRPLEQPPAPRPAGDDDGRTQIRP
ncbi:hypothetical protein NOK12_38300 [Nocardioides sp. OK12]|uniref:aquaporin n=1 Tax=Nocardioides sp. OK12 TaxID=2758661 RepID=UPI0021C4566E|nr:aquaporin [Nocardioides sp. OK12]GHJ61312.1 hypothetical protein NOK12_38300 [Nocardioides sp. OK12]